MRVGLRVSVLALLPVFAVVLRLFAMKGKI